MLLCSLFLSLSCSSRTGSELVVEQLSFHVRDKFESNVPEFEGFLSQPIDCAVDEDGRIFVLDKIENHVVVFDRDLVVVDLIGRRGDGPGEMRMLPQSGNHHLAVGGGHVAISIDPNLIHVFQTDGTFINRFSAENSCTDLIVREDGRIVTHTYEEEFPIVEYDIRGNVLRRYGHAVFRTGDEYAHRRFGVWAYNLGTLAPLPNDGLVTFNEQWMRLRFYREGEFLSESMLDLEKLAINPTKTDLRTIRMLQKEFRDHSPERINRLAKSGRLTRDDFPQMNTLAEVTTDGERIWGVFGGPWLYQFSADGRASRIFEFGDHGSLIFAVRNGQVVFCAGGSIAVATISEALIEYTPGSPFTY